METDTIKKILLLIIAVFAIIGGHFLIGCFCGIDCHTESGDAKVDTLYISDTIVQYEPIFQERVVLEKVLVPVVDTLWKRDTLYVYLDREQVVWQDSLSKVYASGIHPQIDSVKHFITERIITKELTQLVKKPCKWGLGIHAGYGLQFGQQIKTTPYIGIGVNYNILSW